MVASTDIRCALSQRVHSDWRCWLFSNFSSTAKLTTLRCLLTIAAARNWFTHQLDVQNAHCMKLFTWTCHSGIIDRGEHCMSTQQISLWSQTSISNIVFNIFSCDYSLFTRQPFWFMWMIFFWQEMIWQKFSVLKIVQFRIKNLGDLKYFLGIEFSRSKASIYMS